jgi:hypothetical protein
MGAKPGRYELQRVRKIRFVIVQKGVFWNFPNVPFTPDFTSVFLESGETILHRHYWNQYTVLPDAISWVQSAVNSDFSQKLQGFPQLRLMVVVSCWALTIPLTG